MPAACVARRWTSRRSGEVLVDTDGVIRDQHFGEGRYEQACAPAAGPST